jgi:putative peptidoglycan lipid II flippase
MDSSPAPTQTTGKQISRAAGTVMIAFIVSKLIGLLQVILMARIYGTGPDVDAYNTANRVSETLFNLMAGGALASAFVPTFTGLLVKNQKEAAWKLASSIINLLLIILTAVSLAAFIFSHWIVVNALAIGFPPDQQALTERILRVLLPSVVIFGVSGLVMGILNSHQKFLVPALTPSLYSIGCILGMWLFSSSLGIFGLAWGVVIGASLHLLFQLPSLFRLKGKYSFTLGLGIPMVSEVGWLMLPRLFGVSIIQLNFWVNTILCTFQGKSKLEDTLLNHLLGLWVARLKFPFDSGSLTAINFAFALMLVPEAAIAQSIAIAAMPTFSAQASLDRFDELRQSLASSLRATLMLTIPASIGLILLRFPIVAFLYQRGEFTAQSTDLVAWALLWYAAGLVGHSLVEVLSRVFYALHNTWTPVIVGAIAMALNIVFSIIFSVLFTRIGWMPHGGLALANSLATALEMVGLLVLLRRRLVRMEGKRILQMVWYGLAGGGLMAIVLFGWLALSSALPVWLQALGGISIGGGVYLLVMWLLKVPELFSLIASVKNRLLHSSSKP